MRPLALGLEWKKVMNGPYHDMNQTFVLASILLVNWFATVTGKVPGICRTLSDLSLVLSNWKRGMRPQQHLCCWPTILKSWKVHTTIWWRQHLPAWTKPKRFLASTSMTSSHLSNTNIFLNWHLGRTITNNTNILEWKKVTNRTFECFSASTMLKSAKRDIFSPPAIDRWAILAFALGVLSIGSLFTFVASAKKVKKSDIYSPSALKSERFLAFGKDYWNCYCEWPALTTFQPAHFPNIGLWEGLLQPQCLLAYNKQKAA